MRSVREQYFQQFPLQRQKQWFSDACIWARPVCRDRGETITEQASQPGRPHIAWVETNSERQLAEH